MTGGLLTPCEVWIEGCCRFSCHCCRIIHLCALWFWDFSWNFRHNRCLWIIRGVVHLDHRYPLLVWVEVSTVDLYVSSAIFHLSPLQNSLPPTVWLYVPSIHHWPDPNCVAAPNHWPWILEGVPWLSFLLHSVFVANNLISVRLQQMKSSSQLSFEH